MGITFADKGIVAAGTPVGSPEFVEKHVKDCRKKALRVVNKLLELPLAAQDAWAVLTRSLQRKLDHLARACYSSRDSPNDGMMYWLDNFSDEICCAAQYIFGMQPRSTDDADTQQQQPQ